jgi:hypothetical protein
MRKHRIFNAIRFPQWSQNAFKQLIKKHPDFGIEKVKEKHKKLYLSNRKNMPKHCKGHQKSRFRKIAARPSRVSKNIIKSSKNTPQKQWKEHTKSTCEKTRRNDARNLKIRPKRFPEIYENQQNT